MSYEAFAYYYDSLMDQNFYNDYINSITKTGMALPKKYFHQNYKQ